jgi:hypothetical protein
MINLKNNQRTLPINSRINKLRKQYFSDSSIKNEPVILLDNSKNKLILDRKTEIYKIYGGIFLKKNFVENITEIIEDLYDNNEFVFFSLYFLILPENKTINIDFKKLINHFSQYPLEALDYQITKVYKNTGLVECNAIIVWYSCYDINNLKEIASSIKSKLLLNIDIINKTVHLDHKNTIENIIEKINVNSDILLIINANFEHPILKLN